MKEDDDLAVKFLAEIRATKSMLQAARAAAWEESRQACRDKLMTLQQPPTQVEIDAAIAALLNPYK